MNKKKHSDIILRSQQRSSNFGIGKNVVTPKILEDGELKKLLKTSEPLLDISKPIIDEMYDFLQGTGFITILTDKKGCIIDIQGDEDILSEARKMNMAEGAYMDEKSIGTNAIGIVISDNCAIQVTAKEHFLLAYHKWTCSAAPIHDLSGQIMGVLNLTGSSESMHPHTLGLVVAAVNAIESHLQNNDIQKQLQNSNEFAFAMMNSLSYGMFAIDLNDDIYWVNDMACRAINIRRLHLINRPFRNFFQIGRK